MLLLVRAMVLVKPGWGRRRAWRNSSLFAARGAKAGLPEAHTVPVSEGNACEGHPAGELRAFPYRSGFSNIPMLSPPPQLVLLSPFLLSPLLLDPEYRALWRTKEKG